MLDGDAKLVLDALKKITGDDDVYKVVEADEIMEVLPCQMSKLQLSSAIRDLKEREYIKVKYFTPDEYCLITLKRNEEIKQIAEEVVAEHNDNVSSSNVVSVVKGDWKRTFVGALLGSMLGGAVVMAIAIIIIKFAL